MQKGSAAKKPKASAALTATSSSLPSSMVHVLRFSKTEEPVDQQPGLRGLGSLSRVANREYPVEGCTTYACMSGGRGPLLGCLELQR